VLVIKHYLFFFYRKPHKGFYCAGGQVFHSQFKSSCKHIYNESFLISLEKILKIHRRS
jgi:hypothetical protein